MWRGATLGVDKVRVLPSNQGTFPCFLLLNLLVLAPNLKNKTHRIDFMEKKCQEEESRAFDICDKLTMISSLKVYQTLYQNDEQKILYQLIVKSKSSDNLYKNVILS